MLKSEIKNGKTYWYLQNRRSVVKVKSDCEPCESTYPNMSHFLFCDTGSYHVVNVDFIYKTKKECKKALVKQMETEILEYAKNIAELVIAKEKIEKSLKS